MRYRVNLGDRFGKLVVIEVIKSRGSGFQARVRCECGTERQGAVSKLTTGLWKSCGCSKRDRTFGYEMPPFELGRVWSIPRS